MIRGMIAFLGCGIAGFLLGVSLGIAVTDKASLIWAPVASITIIAGIALSGWLFFAPE